MERKQKNFCDYTWIFPDIIGDNHTTRYYLALVLFSSYLLIFNQISINREYHDFLERYEVENADQVPEKFLLLEREYFGLRDQVQPPSFKRY